MGTTDEELASATAGARTLLAFYGSTSAYRPVLDVEGWADLQPELNALSKQGEWAAMAGLVDDTMLRTLAVAGTPQECAAQINDRFGDHARRLCCYFPYATITDERIAELVTALKSP